MKNDCIFCYIIISIIILHTIYIYICKNTNDVIIQDQYPWNKIIQKKYYSEYYKVLDVLSYDSINEWRNIIPGIELNNNELMIPAVQEADALAIANLIISCCNNLISFNEIINKDLIDLSIQKCRSYEFVKKKLRDQIGNHSSENRLKINKIKEIQEPINKKNILKNNTPEPTAYNSLSESFESL